jgi:hypothetical protein
MKTGGQISQSPVVWWYCEVNCEVVGLYKRSLYWVLNRYGTFLNLKYIISVHVFVISFSDID